MTTAIVIIGLILALLIHKKPVLGILLIIFFATLGELGRLPESTGINYILNDIFIPILIAIWLIKSLAFDRKIEIPPLLPPILIWVLIAALSLIANSTWLASGELKESALYLARFISYFFLYIITYNEIKKSPKDWNLILAGLVIGAVLVSIFGFIQLKYYPSFYDLNMMEEGWDPHVGRLLSTWFDPNFVGGMLGFILCILFGITISDKKILGKPRKIILIAIPSLIMLAALYYTYSRSAYLACGIGILTITGIKSRKLLLLGILCMGLLFATMGKAQDRLLDLWESFQSFLGTSEYASYFNPDATSRLRIDSWQNAIAVIKEHFWLGSGYNSFKYAQSELGLINDLDEHYATGSDSTLLTIFATTGILGILAYICFYIQAITTSIKNFLHNKNILQSGYNLGLMGALIGILIHSTFVNSLLFPHTMVFLWISLGLSITNSRAYQPPF